MQRGYRLTASIAIIVSLLVAPPSASPQTRLEFHMLPAVSTGPLDPAFSPDDATIAFSMRGDIWTVPTAGGEAVALTEGPHYYFEPAFSPDGSLVAVSMLVEGDFEIGLVDRASATVRRVTDRPGLDVNPSWTPDGESLVFASRRDRDLDIYRYDLATGRTSLIVSRPGNDFHPAVSPDGRKLAFVSRVRNRGGSGGLWIMPLPDGEPELVHYEQTSYRPKPAFSPDGAALVYISDAAGSNDVAVVPASGGDRARLTEDPLDELDAAWSHDGATIAFVSNHEGPTRLYTLGAGGGPRSFWRRVAMTSRRPRAPSGRVRGSIVDADGGAVPGRVFLTASDGRAYTEDDGFQRVVWETGEHYFHTARDGRFEVEVPAGRLDLEVMRGFEYVPASRSVEVPAGGAFEVTIELERLVDAPAEGWFSGDTHTHDLHEGRFGLTQDDFFAQLVADDVHVTNALIHMDGTKLMGRWTDLTGEPDIRSTADHILYYTQEFRGSFGHVALLGVNRFIMPLIGGAANTPYAPDVLKLHHMDEARAQGGIVGFVHPYNASTATPEEAARSADIPVHVALGRGDFFDVISIASLELETAAIYYRLLNCGFRIAATGGTDNFSDVYRDPSGGTARTYAHLAGPLDYRSWLEAVKAGRTFATSGPLLFLSVDGKTPGDTIETEGEASRRLDVRLRVASIAPLERVELVVNGEVAHTWPLEGEALHDVRELQTTLSLPTSGWVTARAIGPESRYVGDTFAFAQTSPVYVVRDGKPYTSAEDARFLLATVDALWELVEARDTWHTEAQKEAYRAGIEQARAVYREIIATASR